MHREPPASANSLSSLLPPIVYVDLEKCLCFVRSNQGMSTKGKVYCEKLHKVKRRPSPAEVYAKDFLIFDVSLVVDFLRENLKFFSQSIKLRPLFNRRIHS